VSERAAFRINGQEVEAAAFYAAACDPRRSIAVEACAGAGKTWMLISRILRALLADEEGDSCQAQEILAITFTRKAAGEMRQRLQEWLQDYARADEVTLLKALADRGVQGLDQPQRAQRLCQRLQQLYASMLANGQSVEFRTFHGWFASLLQAAPVSVLQRLQLPVPYELLEDDGAAIRQVWPRFLRAVSERPQSQADFEALVRDHGRHQVAKALETALERRTEFEWADAHGRVVSSVKRFQEQFPRFAQMSDLRAVLGSAPEAALLQQAAGFLCKLSAPSFAAKGQHLKLALETGDLDGVLAALLVTDASGRRSPRKFGRSQSEELVRQAGTLALELSEVQSQDQAWAYQQRMTRLSRLMIAQFRALKQERGWIDMQDLERAALELLSDESLAGWMQERLDAQVKHLLVDEFQDTNPMQWQAMHAWLASYAGASRAIRVFFVGDPKQSVYRFRRAEPRVWFEARDFVRASLGGDLLSCDHTRRNAGQVVQVVNAVMHSAVLANEFDDYRTHTTESQHEGQVVALPQISIVGKRAGASEELSWRDSLKQSRWWPEEKQIDIEVRQAAAWVAGQLERRSLGPGDVMVLSRKRDRLLPMQAALLGHGVPADIDESMELIEFCEIQDLVALLDVLVSPRHDLSLARVLRSPLFGLDSNALIVLAQCAAELALPWLVVLQQGQDSLALRAQPWAADLLSAGLCLSRWQRWLAQLPPHDALQALFEDGDVIARYAAAAPPLQREAVQVRLQALMMQSLTLEGGRYLSAYGLVRALKAGGLKAPKTNRADAVRLLTVHGAKGLEADTVLILNSDAGRRRADTMGVLVDWPGAEPTRLVFLQSESRPPACCRDVLARERRAQDREEINLLYVAATRAKRTLALSSCESGRDSAGSPWKRLAPYAQEQTVAEALQNGAQTSSGQVTVQLPVLPERPAGWTALSEPAAQDQTLTESARIGLAMHRLLEWGTVEAQALGRVAGEFALDAEQTLRAAEAARSILQGEGAWVWQKDRLLWQGNELELVHEGRLQRLDRLVKDRDGTWWVLDHKSCWAPQIHMLDQLRAYARAVCALHPGQRVRAAFLTPQGRLIEVPTE